MAIVKTKEKNSYHHLGLRISETLQNRIDTAFNQLATVQDGLKKAELIREAIERGLDSIESELNEVVTSNE